jgi:hypothetical protein
MRSKRTATKCLDEPTSCFGRWSGVASVVEVFKRSEELDRAD